MAFSLSTALGLSSIVSTATSIAGGILGVVGAVQEHNQAQANSEMQAQQMEYNQRLEEREASRIEQETAENARRQREASEQLKSAQRALLGKSGAAMTSGSPLAILGQTAEDEERKIQDVHYAGYQRSWFSVGRMLHLCQLACLCLPGYRGRHHHAGSICDGM